MDSYTIFAYIASIFFAFSIVRPNVAYGAFRTFCEKSYFKRINIGFLSRFYTDVKTGEEKDNTIFLRVFVFEVINDVLTLGTIVGIILLFVYQKDALTLTLFIMFVTSISIILREGCLFPMRHKTKRIYKETLHELSQKSDTNKEEDATESKEDACSEVSDKGK